MKALIIASGRGKRIKNFFSPKPLIPLLGLTLIERVILTAKKAGIKDFFIVVGYLKEKIKESLGKGEKYGVNIEYIDNDEWEKENGVSVLKASPFLKENFILLMADHIFDYRILLELKKQKLEEGGILCIDKNPKEYIDLNDATKVKLKNGYIENIGKGLKEWDGIDTGIFLLSPAIFDALKEAVKESKTTLSEGIKILSKTEKVRGLDINNNFWIDIDTEKELRIAQRELLLETGKITDGVISRKLNRPLSRFLTKFLVKTKLTPNMISFISFISASLAAFLFSLGGYLNTFIAGLITQFSSIIDGCDGEVAKLKFQESEYGGWLDACLDRYADALLILGICLGLSKISFSLNIWIVGFFALIGSFMNSYTATKYDALFKEKKVKPKVRVGRDLRYFIIMLGAIVNKLFPTLFILALITNAETIRRIYVFKKKVKIKIQEFSLRDSFKNVKISRILK